MRTDNDIKRDVESQLKWEPDVDETDIAVNVTSGVVALAGFVRRYSDRYAAERAVKRVAGVAGVANDIEVRIETRDRVPDPELAREAVSAVRGALPLVHEKVKVVVRDGTITLEGALDWRYQSDLAEQAVLRLKGAKYVTNLIAVKPRVVAADDVKRKIEAALVRNAQLDANRISVEAHGTEIILRGNVRAWEEREEAQRTAWAAPGVTQVKNEIHVSYA